MTTTPLHQFDVQLSKHLEGDVFTAWKLTINKSLFPNINLKNGEKRCAHLDEIKQVCVSERENFLITLGKGSISLI